MSHIPLSPPTVVEPSHGQMHNYYDIQGSPVNNIPPLAPLAPLAPPTYPPQQGVYVSDESLQQRRQYAKENERIQQIFNPPVLNHS